MYSIDRSKAKLVLGIDPGLNNTGWGIVRCKSNTFEYIASGTVTNASEHGAAIRLKKIFDNLLQIIESYQPYECSVEETFVNRNPYLSLKLGYAKGVALLAASSKGLPVFEYAPCLVKKALTGNGSASKHQIANMIKCLMPHNKAQSEHETDALAIAICHINTLPVVIK